jgi:hydroxymethylpyrimidine/phosphomethylpyrimidine kinase
MKIFSALTIGGIDPSGGAGVTADMFSFNALGVYGASVITAVTAQNTKGVSGIYALKPKEVSRQMDAVFSDMEVKAVKTGLLVNEEIVDAVSRKLRGKENVVVDPVLFAGTGARLLSERGFEAMKEKLIPLAALVTPNTIEAERLSGVRVSSLESAKEAAMEIGKSADAVLVKGGHLPSKEDVLYYEGKFHVFQPSVRVGENVHGTGCSLAACVAAELSKGKELVDAVGNAKKVVEWGIRNRLKVGGGSPVINPTLLSNRHPSQITNEVENALFSLSSLEGFEKLLPEVGSNLVMAKKNARSCDDVAGISGRMRKGKGRVESGPVCLGASKHMASALLEIMKYDGEKRALLNIRYDKKILETCRELGYVVRGISRGEEPRGISELEGMSLPWVVKRIIRDGGIPDVIYHDGGVGKEPMVWITGKSASDVACKVMRILGEL